MSDLPPSATMPSRSFTLLKHGQPIELAIASSLTWPTSSSSRQCSLALSCTMWTAHDSVRTPRVPRSKPTRVYHSPPLVHRHEPFVIYLHITSQETHQIYTTLSITHHPRVTTISPQNFLEKEENLHDFGASFNTNSLNHVIISKTVMSQYDLYIYM